MLLKKILLAVLLFVCSFSYSQLTKIQSTSRMLKTATSLLEAQQFEAAEEYFKKGLQNAIASNDFYNQALAHEGLGNLYSKSDQKELAVSSYRQAIKLYAKEEREEVRRKDSP